MTSNSESLVIPPGGVLPPMRSPEELARMKAARETKQTKQKRKDAMRRRWTLLNAFVDDGMAGLESSDVAVWVALFRNATPDGVATVARARLVAITGVTHKTVIASLSRLICAGWLARLHRGGPNGGIAVYRVQAPEKVV